LATLLEQGRERRTLTAPGLQPIDGIDDQQLELVELAQRCGESLFVLGGQEISGELVRVGEANGVAGAYQMPTDLTAERRLAAALRAGENDVLSLLEKSTAHQASEGSPLRTCETSPIEGGLSRFLR